MEIRALSAAEVVPHRGELGSVYRRPFYRHAFAIAGQEATIRHPAGRFEVAELAVRPAAEGRGLGGALLDSLLTGLPHDGAWLLVHPDAGVDVR